MINAECPLEDSAISLHTPERKLCGEILRHALSDWMRINGVRGQRTMPLTSHDREKLQMFFHPDHDDDDSPWSLGWLCAQISSDGEGLKQRIHEFIRNKDKWTRKTANLLSANTRSRVIRCYDKKANYVHREGALQNRVDNSTRRFERDSSRRAA